jgi:hypothetical protein
MTWPRRRDDAADLGGRTRHRDRAEQKGRRPKSNATLGNDQAAKKFLVWIDAFGRRRLWSRYPSRQRAEQEVVGLRRHGFDAIVEVAT